MSQPEKEAMRRRWTADARAAGLDPDPALGDALIAAYCEPHRRYHTLRHIADLLDEIETRTRPGPARHRLKLAAWFHDAVYQPGAGDNEELSARWAERALPAAGASAPLVTQIARLIRATADHQSPGGDASETLFLDLDFAILGSPPHRYDAYARAIRDEYSQWSDAVFAAGRTAFLTDTLARERIFLTPEFEAQFGDQARANMRREIDRLQA